MLTLLSVIIVAFFLYFLTSPKVLSLSSKADGSFYVKNRINKVGLYVFGLILSQGLHQILVLNMVHHIFMWLI